MRIYLAGPIGTAPHENYELARPYANELMDRGHNVFVPHFSIFLGQERDYERWMDWGNSFLRVCEALYRIPGESPGSDREIKVAEELGLIIFRSMDEVPVITPS